MGPPVTEPCWYCGGPSTLLCDYPIGREQVPGRCSSANCPNPAALIVGAGPEFVVCEPCAASPEHRRKRTRKPFDPAATRALTCDAAACRRCAARFGWRTTMSAIVCVRSGPARGCHNASTDHCHAHAGVESDELLVGEALKSACAAVYAAIQPVSATATSSPRSWRNNTALFLAELRAGRRWQEWVAGELKFRGLKVELPEHRERERIEHADMFTAHDNDLTIRGSAVGDCVLEVKSRDMYFLDPAGYPYPTALVDTVDGWNAKAIEPRAVLLVSRQAKRILVVSAATRREWLVQQVRDRYRNTSYDAYYCPRERLASLEWLVQKLLP